MTAVSFFLGANTPTGFVGFMPSCYQPQEGWWAYIIKGGPGSGKSTFMRRILERLTAEGEEAEAILCSSDPQSLDGVRFPQMRAVVLDGTAPHVVEPRYWGACETIVDIGGCADTHCLQQNAEAIMLATDACSEQHAACRGCLATAAALLADSRRMALRCTDTDKVVRAAARLAEQEWGSAAAGREERRFLSAVTPEGAQVLYGTLQALCPRIYVMEDEYGAAGGLLLGELRRLARERELAVITCTCPLAPEDKVEHLLFPSVGVGFTLSNSWHKVDFPAYRRIHAARFTDESALQPKRQRLAFNRRAARDLVGQAVEAAVQAKALHDDMERFSREAMDFAAVDRLCDRVSEELLARHRTFAGEK